MIPACFDAAIFAPSLIHRRLLLRDETRHEAFCPASLHDGTPTSVGVPSLFRSRPAKQRRSLDRILGSGMFPRLVERSP